MKYILIFFLCLKGISIDAQGIDFFHGSWEEVLEEAKAKDKLIFVDAFTTWCGPCKRMAKNVFTQDEVGKVFNKKYINVKINMEDPDNMSFIRKYPVSAYPTLFFINADGKVVDKSVGGKTVNALLGFASAANKKDDKSVKYVEAYKNGARDFELVYNYVVALNKANKPSLKISNDYWNSNPDISEKEKSAFLFGAVTEADSKLFDEMIARRKQIISVEGKTAFDNKIMAACNKTISKGIEYEIYDLVEEAIEKYKKEVSKSSKSFVYKSQLRYYSQTGNVSNYLVIAKKYLKKEAKKNEDDLLDLLNELNVKYKSREEGKKLLLSGYKDLVKKYKTWKNRVAYSKMLLYFNMNEEALKQAEKALESLKEEESMYRTSIEKLIEHIKSKEIGD